MSKNIGVLGCGWLGFPLAVTLVSKGHMVYGTSTSNQKLKTLSDAKIKPFQMAISETSITGDILKFLNDLEILIVNIPPKLRGKCKENYVKKVQLLHTAVKKTKIKKVLFISSTSVYGSIDGPVDEDTKPTPDTTSGIQILAAEQVFALDTELNTTVIRFGGLIGPDRHPVTILSGRSGLKNGNAPINLIHLNDCISIITAVIEKSWWNELFNGVYPNHPKKREYYSYEAQKRGLQTPDFKLDTPIKGKVIRSKRLLDVKNFKFTTSL